MAGKQGLNWRDREERQKITTPTRKKLKRLGYLVIKNWGKESWHVTELATGKRFLLILEDGLWRLNPVLQAPKSDATDIDLVRDLLSEVLKEYVA